MSYILDALKKSEQQRASAQPAPAMVSLPTGAADTHARPVLPAIALALAVLLCILFIGWWWPTMPATTATAPAPGAVPQVVPDAAEVAEIPETRLPEVAAPVWVTAEQDMTTEPTVAPEPELQAELAADSRPSESRPVAARPVEARPVEARPVEARVQTRRLPPLESLRRIPALMINSHIYSPLADKRSVTINNRAWREGEPLAEGIVLQEITPQGIVLDVDGWPLPVNRQQGWQPVPQ